MSASKQLYHLRMENIAFNPPQQQILEYGFLASGFSVVLQMPTGSGKTWLAEHAIADVLSKGARAIYLAPIRALANELFDRWGKHFPRAAVGVFTGEYAQRAQYPVSFEDARLLIMTPERLDACTRNWRAHWSWLPQVALLVVDELHVLADRNRGPRLEGALMRVRRLNPFLRTLGLSATLGNRAELAEWLGGVHYETAWRSIPIEWRYARYQRASDKPQILKQEVAQCVTDGGQSLVFVQSRRRAEALAVELAGHGIAAGHHHAGLDSIDRRRLEDEFRAGRLRALVSTGTLEVGLNLPARQVVLYDLQWFDGTDFVPLSVNTVWQRAGRAGRRGFDERGEVVLLCPSWDRHSQRYAEGRFEAVKSGLDEPHALAEQVLAEVASGLARTRAQLRRNLWQSLAAHQRRLPSLERVIDDMIESGMLLELMDENAQALKLRPTRLGRIAVRQMLAPATVLTLARSLIASDAERLTFFDLLLLCASTLDCEPLIPADFEELEALADHLAAERSCLLSGSNAEIQQRLDCNGRHLLAIAKTALVLREWTRTGDATDVGEKFGCYAFEVRRVSESLGRILTAARATLAPDKEHAGDEESRRCASLTEEPPLRERVNALAAMVAHGVDEQVVTLTFIRGIGGTIARRLGNAGIQDIEDLALAEPEDLLKIRGVSTQRAVRWIDEASQAIRCRSAFSFRESGDTVRTSSETWPSNIDPYRLRRALDLDVRAAESRFVVTGGLEPHRVTYKGKQLSCDCMDHMKGHVCKHVLAVRIHSHDAELRPLVQRLAFRSTCSGLDLFNLWFQGRQR